MAGIPLNKGDIYKIHVSHGLLWFTVVAVQTFKLGSKLSTQAQQLRYSSSKTSFSDTIT